MSCNRIKNEIQRKCNNILFYDIIHISNLQHDFLLQNKSRFNKNNAGKKYLILITNDNREHYKLIVLSYHNNHMTSNALMLTNSKKLLNILKSKLDILKLLHLHNI